MKNPALGAGLLQSICAFGAFSRLQGGRGGTLLTGNEKGQRRFPDAAPNSRRTECAFGIMFKRCLVLRQFGFEG